MGKKNERGAFKLVIPLDASEVENFKPEQKLKVLAVNRRGETRVEIVQLDGKGKGGTTLSFSENPGDVHVVVGPESASDEDIQGMQTLSLDITARQWGVSREISVPAIRVSDYFWYWWLRWCRTFVIRGRVVCPDGSPVPGAQVCASDVDMWWWWRSTQQVGCATTDATGSFTLRFRWCCGFYPWWWWRRRVWQLDPRLADIIVPVLQRDPRIPRIPIPDPAPDLSIFEHLLSNEGNVTHPPMTTFKPDALEGLRERLAQRIPASPEIQKLRLWPWWPWQPWWDCTPDIIFRVTQECQGRVNTIVNEGVGDIRWDIPTSLNVTLVANNLACCIQPPPGDPEGNCMVITDACDDQVNTIGGNPGAPPTPAGFVNPGLISIYGDRPYAGNVPISGQFGNAASVDYYEFEWSANGVVWNAMPPAAAGGFGRGYWGPKLGGGGVNFWGQTFPFTTISGRNVIESRQHFEAHNDPLSWGVTRFWSSNRDLLMNWMPENNFADGTYFLRVKAYDLVAGNLAHPRILPLCDTNNPNGIVLTIDNRIVGPGSGHPPSVPNHPCGGGTVHLCTMEPDTDILDVRILHAGGGATTVGACGNVPINNSDILQVDFFAYDPNGHLAYFSLIDTYGENLAINLLGLGGTLTPLGGAPVPPAAQVGPDYGTARAVQGAAAPIWAGGAVRLQVPAHLAFPETCCYQLELRAYKRTIVGCYDGFAYANLSEYSFTVVV